MYDIKHNNSLEREQIKNVIHAMIYLLNCENYDLELIVDDCIGKLDKNKDGVINSSNLFL